MRFNPKVKLDTDRVGDAGGSGGLGGGGMQFPIPGGAKAGGGLGMLVVVLLFLAVSCLGGGNGGGVQLPTDDTFGGATGTDASRMTDSERYANCQTGADANSDADCARVAVENSLYNFWSQELAKTNVTFQPATMTTFSGGVNTGCGTASSQVGPFYCPPDQTIYLDTTFFEEVLQGQLGGQGGDFVEPYVIGHEYGHHIQNLAGIMNQVKTQQGPKSDAVRLELQADCFAGLWARSAANTTSKEGVQIFESLDESDITEALDSARAVGDDRIQQRSGGRVDPDSWTHGSAEQRQRWFMTGYETGDINACDTFSASTL